MTTTIDHALAYARRGWRVFPVRLTKRPYTAHGCKDATLDEGQISSWWHTWPRAGIGVATGYGSRIWVLDIDTAKGGQVSLDALELQHGPLKTLEVRTGGGGRHLYFRWPDRQVRNRADIEPGIDARGEGGYVVAPPSGHESGQTYAWSNDLEPVDAPAWLLDLVAPVERPRAPAEPVERPAAAAEPIRNPRAYGDAALRRAEEEVRVAPEGRRNATLNAVTHSLARLVREGCLTRGRVESAMQLAGEQAGLTAAETRATIASALGDAREPVDAPPADVPRRDVAVDGGTEPEAPERPRVLPSADPLVLAKYYLGEQVDERGRLLLRRWRSAWWRYDGGAYRELSDEEAEAPIWRWLGAQWVRAGDQPKRVGTSMSKIANLSRALTSLNTYVDSTVTPPIWVSGERGPSDVVPVVNGLLDLATGDLAPHTPDLFATGRLDVAWDPSAGRPRRWLGFLEQLFGEDWQAVELLGEWFGYCLDSDTSQQKMLFIVGPKRSGKGTIARVLTALVGRDRIAGPTLSGLAGPFGLQPLLSKPVAIIADARIRGRTDEAAVLERLLSITGEDSITVDRKNKDAVTARLPTRLMALSNEIPKLSDASGALASRMLVLELQASFYGREDVDLEARLLEELPGILAWAVDGWRRLRERGRFVEPESSAEAKEELAMLASDVARCLRDEFVPDREGWIEIGAAYSRYIAWCKDEGIQPKSKPTFGRDMHALGIRRSRPRDANAAGRRPEVYIGITTRSAGV